LKDQDIQGEKLLALGSIAGGIAHDLNNLLMAVLGHISFLKFSDQSTSSMESIEAAEVGIKRAAKLVQQILDFARKAEDNIQKNCDICALVRSSIPLVSPSLPETITLGLKLQESQIIVTADEAQLTQIILNLMMNARDAMPSGGKINISIDKVNFEEDIVINGFILTPGIYGKLRVSDQGHGISAQIRGKIFDPFFTTKRGTGTGFGLATVFFLVKSLGGAIDVSSEVGTGTTFDVLLPLLGSELSNSFEAEIPSQTLAVKNKFKEQLEETKNVHPRQQQKKILVVDDEEAVRLVLQRSLEILGYEVDTAEDGKVAIGVFEKNPTSYSLVVMDMIMPNMAGDELFYKLKEIDSDVKVLISSGYSSDGKTQNLIANGAKGFIQKPFAIEELAREVESVLAL